MAEEEPESAESPSASASAASVPVGLDGEEADKDRLVMYKTKLVQFLGRATPIILQNDNGPCPLLAICNVLLLRNIIHINSDVPEVSQDQLLTLVANRLLESNINVKSKDEAYMSNQQQNISDAIDLLPRLATGIDVNVHFRKINDFEFTPECAIFDLLDIGLYHGWIFDPEEKDTTAAIGSKSYNTLAGELVALEMKNSTNDEISTPEEDCVDFAAAKAAVLGVPCPSLSRGRSFDDPPALSLDEKIRRKGDIEEEAELMRALELSNSQLSASVNHSLSPDHSTISNIPCSVHSESSVARIVDESDNSREPDVIFVHKSNACLTSNCEDRTLMEEVQSPKYDGSGNSWSPISEECRDSRPSEEIKKIDLPVVAYDSTSHDIHIGQENSAKGDHFLSETESDNNYIPENQSQQGKVSNSFNLIASSDHAESNTDHNFLCESTDFNQIPQGSPSSLESSEPIYEGEECILDSSFPNYEIHEPEYEGEAVLAEQADRRHSDPSCAYPLGEVTGEQCTISARDGQLIRSFLNNNASQLTIYGLFRLQEGLNERELCVFFRNNHFSTMFKYEGELYLLVTDQGYINQPDLVWEKLNEVNGDTVFMTGNFKEFKVEHSSNEQWDQQNAMTSTADYLASLRDPENTTSYSSDLQLAMALQQQEFEEQQQSQRQEQPQPQPPPNVPQPSGTGRSRLIVGPQIPRNAPSPAPKQESKSKDKCIVM